MKQYQRLLLRSLTIAYITVFLSSFLWNILSHPAEHMICSLLHGLLAILGGNICLFQLKDVPTLEISWRNVLPCAAIVMGVFLNVVMHALFH